MILDIFTVYNRSEAGPEAQGATYPVRDIHEEKRVSSVAFHEQLTEPQFTAFNTSLNTACWRLRS